jgi:hypothetical protein
MLPAMKAARLTWQASSLHWWAQRNCTRLSMAQLAFVRLAFAMPGVTATLWVGAGWMWAQGQRAVQPWQLLHLVEPQWNPHCDLSIRWLAAAPMPLVEVHRRFESPPTP